MEVVDIDISNGNVIKARDDIALIDADTIVYASCLSCQNEVELFDKSFYTETEWFDIINSEGYNAKTNTMKSIDLEVAYSYAKDKIESILESTGCKDYELHFTLGRKSFRYTRVFPDYKANRLEDNEGKNIPIGLAELKDLFVVNEPTKAFKWTEWEADDIVVAKKRYFPSKYLLVALDKDVLYSLPGEHFNYYSSAKYNIDMKFFTVTAEEAMKHHYIQCLTGDASDGIPGLHRVGKKTAYKMLKHCTSPSQCWERVLLEYEARGKDSIDAITTMRLVSMNQLVYDEETDSYAVMLWRPKNESISNDLN